MNNIKSIEETLETNGMFVSTTTGLSMYPMLRERQDTIVVRVNEKRLKKNDIALYKVGSTHVLHRVVRVGADSYVMRGDNCDCKEYGISDDCILGVLVEFYRGEKKVSLNDCSYKLYCRCLPVWRVYRWARRMCGNILRGVRKGSKFK